MQRGTRREVHPRAGHPAAGRGPARARRHGRRPSGAWRSRGAGVRRTHRWPDPWRHEPRCLESPRSLPSERERGGRSLGAGARRARRGPYPWPSEPRCLEPARGLPSEQEMGRACQDLGGPWQRVTSRGLPSPRRGPPRSAVHLWELSRACAFATSAERVSPTYWRSAAGEARQSATTSWTAAKLSCGAVRDERSTRERGTRPQVEARRGRVGTGVARAEHGEAAALVLGGPTDARTPGVTNQDASIHHEVFPVNGRGVDGASALELGGLGAARTPGLPSHDASNPHAVFPASKRWGARTKTWLARGRGSRAEGHEPRSPHPKAQTSAFGGAPLELSRACAFATSAERVSPTYWRSAAGEARRLQRLVGLRPSYHAARYETRGPPASGAPGRRSRPGAGAPARASFERSPAKPLRWCSEGPPMPGPLASRTKMPRITPKSSQRTGEGWTEPRRWSSEGLARPGPLAFRATMPRTRTRSSQRARDGARVPRLGWPVVEGHEPRSPQPKARTSAFGGAPLGTISGVRVRHLSGAGQSNVLAFSCGRSPSAATTSWTAAKLSCGAVRDERSTRERGTRPSLEARRGGTGTAVVRAEHGEAAALVLGGPTDARTPGVTSQDASNHPGVFPANGRGVDGASALVLGGPTDARTPGVTNQDASNHPGVFPANGRGVDGASALELGGLGAARTPGLPSHDASNPHAVFPASKRWGARAKTWVARGRGSRAEVSPAQGADLRLRRRTSGNYLGRARSPPQRSGSVQRIGVQLRAKPVGCND
jgi:hypothetical protein